MAHDNCDQCGEDYDFEKGRDVLCLYIDEPRCNHVLATCPHCGYETHIFLDAPAVMSILDLQLKLRLGQRPDSKLRKMAEKLLAELEEEENEDTDEGYGEAKCKADQYPDLPQPSRDDLIGLWTTMRHFGGECGGCLWCD